MDVMSGDRMFKIYPSRTLDVLTIASDEGFEKTFMVVGGDRLETSEVDLNIFCLGLSRYNKPCSRLGPRHCCCRRVGVKL